MSLVSLEGGFRLWSDFVLRSTGMPFEWVLPLASPSAARAADRLIALELEVAALEGRHGMRGDGTAGDSRLDEYRARLADETGRFATAFRLASEVTSRQLRVQVERPLVREALLWQNRAFVSTSYASFMRRPATDRSSETRRFERAYASYLKRYCTKNDTIGFFGPVLWARLDPSVSTEIAPGRSLFRARRTFFEYWSVHALASSIAQVPGVRTWLAPRLSGLARVEGALAVLPLGVAELSAPVIRVVEWADGERKAWEIARELTQREPGTFGDVGSVYAALDEAVELGALVWGVDLSADTLRPERRLQTTLERIGDAKARDMGLQMLGEFLAAKGRVEGAAGNPEQLDLALGELEETFSRLSGLAPTRRAGKAHAGRTLCHEECRRDARVVLGRKVVERAQPLSLLLQSLRWLTYVHAQRLREELMGVYRELVAQTGASRVPGFALLSAASELFASLRETGKPKFALEVIKSFQERWGRLIGWSAQDPRRRVVRDLDEVSALADELFRAPCPGWPSARQHSPDLMLAGAGPESVAAGEFTLVVGEIHYAVNNLEYPFFWNTHDEPEALMAASVRDVPCRVNTIVDPAHASARLMMRFDRPDDLDLETNAGRSFRPKNQVLRLADLFFELRAGRLVADDSSNGRAWDVIELCDSLLGDDMPSLLAPEAHTPRVTIGEMVFCRETWRWSVDRLRGLHRAGEADRFLAVRRWAAECGLPRFVFVRHSAERKPVCCDLEAPIDAEILAALVRKEGSLTVSEMLPAPDQLWLPDAARRLYTSELRLVAVDPEPWRPDA